MIKLYIKQGCPFCMKVLAVIEEMELKEDTDYKILDIMEDPTALDTLMEVGGSRQVPFLIDSNTSMYESDDIITYIKKKFSEKKE